jgi:hypothetical protein
VTETDPTDPHTRREAITDAGYCPHCGRGDAGPTAEAYEELRQRAERAEATIARVRAELDRWMLNTLEPQTRRALSDALAALDPQETPDA